MDWMYIKDWVPEFNTKIWGMDKNGNAVLGLYDESLLTDTPILKDEKGTTLIYPLERWATYEVIY